MKQPNSIEILRLNSPLERIYFNWDKVKNNDYMFRHMFLHIERYSWALQFVRNKIVADIGCGTCYGSWMLSIAARKMFLIDYSDDLLDYSQRFPFCCETTIINEDINNIALPKCDVSVCFEFIEHMQDPVSMLSRINSDRLIWSVPINLRAVYHPIRFRTIDHFLSVLNDGKWNNIEDEMHERKLSEISFYHGVANR